MSRAEAPFRGTLNGNVVLYRLRLAWAAYLEGLRERYKLLVTPAQRGFFLPWAGFFVFVAVAFRWQTDIMLLGVLVLRHCVTPSIARLQHEVLFLPIAMVLAIAVMMVTLVPVQQSYYRAVPLWVTEAFAAIVPISVLMTLVGLGFYWIDLKTACG